VRWCAPLEAGGLGQPWDSFGQVTPGIVGELQAAAARAARKGGRREQAGTVGQLISLTSSGAGRRAGKVGATREPVVIVGPWTGTKGR
jgi:hypothetical protein